MTNKTTMQEPVGCLAIDRLGKTEFIGSTRASEDLGEGSYGLITTTQAEAYAEARVREALEEAAEVGLNAPHTSGMIDSEDARALSFHVHSRIRSLI